jgi:hypothetical protein
MPAAYHINPDDGLVTVRAEGTVSFPELTDLGRSLLADRHFDPELPQLLDFRGMRPWRDAGLEDFRAFVHGPYRQRVAASIAVVIDGHLETRHCADIFLLTCAVPEAELFADYDQALRWLVREAFATTSAQEEDAPHDDAHRAPEQVRAEIGDDAGSRVG